ESLKSFIIKAGISTADIEDYVEERIRKSKAVPAFKGYRGYPASTCTSINEQVVHGIPSRTVRLKNGDIISIDLGVVLDGFYGDGAITVPVGDVGAEALKLTKVTEEALYKGIKYAVAGNRVSDISAAIQQHVEGHGFSVVRAFVGHGIGRSLHEDPQVPNFGTPGQGPRLKEGMTLAIEPMVNAGDADVRILDDGWTAITADGQLSAHFEHTVAITRNGPKILTKV
ncbi:MAG: type I methionyl aminopeptidase, partial [Nitrospirae bacterium]|nr:type I methionyl aminopeptidase [Nitrospirota bacterium]